MKTLLIFCLGLAALSLTGCQVDSEVIRPEKDDRFRLSLVVDDIGTGSQAQTRATVPSTGGEDNVESLYLLFYESQPNGQGPYAGMLEYTGPLQMNMTISMSSAGLSNDKDYSILALANIEKFIGNSSVTNYLDGLALLNEAQATEQATFELTGVNTDETDDSRKIVQTALAMSGKASKNKGENEVVLKLTRAVSRFDVQNTRSAQYDMVSVSIWNGSELTPVWGNSLSGGSQTFTERFYGLKREVPSSGELQDIVGGLYSFENFQTSPTQNDKKTTCLIVGLAPKAGAPLGTEGKTMYYRINIRPEASSQNLKRNYVYKVSIRSVNKEGAESEYVAWSGASTGLEVSINNWNLDEEGMILTDGTNTMVVPVKRVRLDPLGDAREYSIFTMGTGALTISKTQLPTGVTAHLEGNLLVVKATSMAQTETERRGSIELAFAGLRGTIDFIQSYNESTYLTLSRSNLAAYPALGATDRDLEISSSGPWSARIYNMSSGSNPGFTFPRGGMEAVTELSGNDGDMVSIWTTGDNPNNESRYSFVVFSLDSDPDINRAMILTQKPVSILKLDPQETTITFGPLGEPRGINNAVPGNAFTFTVDPGSDEGVLNDWEAELTGADAEYFQLTVTSLGFSQKVEIVAKGTEGAPPHQNMAARNLNANLRVWLTDAAPGTQGTEINVAISQEPVGLDYSLVGDLSAVPVTGVKWANAGKTQVSGDYVEYDIEVSASTQWNAEIQSDGIASHKVFLIDGSGNKVTSLSNMSSTDNLKVGFDKIHYPLVETTPVSQIKVSIVGSAALNVIINVSQDALIPRYMNVVDVMNNEDPYGSITWSNNSGRFITFYSNYVMRSNLFGPSGVVKTKSVPVFTGYARASFPYSATSAIPFMGTDGKGATNSVAYVHMGGREGQFYASHIEATENWRMNTDAVMVWPHDISTETWFKDSRTVLNKAGYVYLHPNRDGYDANTFNSNRNNRIMTYLLKDGPFSKGIQLNTSMTFYNDSTCSGIDESSLKEGAVSVINHTKNGSGNNAALLVIDPKNRFVFIGDGQLFHTDGNIPAAGSVYTASSTPSSDKDKFLCNLLAYIINAAQYGSHFTDIFIDDTLSYPFPEN